MLLHSFLILSYSFFIDIGQVGKPVGNNKSEEVVQVIQASDRALLYTPHSGKCHQECDHEDCLPLTGFHAS